MKRPLNQIDEVGKALLIALKTCGRHKSFTEILEGIGARYTNDKQTDLANTLEALGLIESVTYRLPFEIRAELSPTGLKLVNRMKVESKKAAALVEKKRRGKTEQTQASVPKTRSRRASQ